MNESKLEPHYFSQRLSFQFALGVLQIGLQNIFNKSQGIKIDALLICGDFQCLRDQNDMSHMHCPIKYRQMGAFNRYWSGESIAPILTIFIGGNHEAVNNLRSVYYGGYVAPNIYFLGMAGCIYLNNRANNMRLRIGGLSGIYSHYDFMNTLKLQPLPYNHNSMVSAYHVKQADVFRLELLGRIRKLAIKSNCHNSQHQTAQFDIFLSHDWPRSNHLLMGLEDMPLYGQLKKLYIFKPFLRQQIEQGKLGCPPKQRLLDILQPNYWFSAHLHVKYSALYPHNSNGDQKEESKSTNSTNNVYPPTKYTHFLSLDKMLPKRHTIQVIRLQQKEYNSSGNTNNSSNSNIYISYDPIWLQVLKLTPNIHNHPSALYKYEKGQLIVKQPQFMNQLLTKYMNSSQQSHKNTYEQYLPLPFHVNQTNNTIALVNHIKALNHGQWDQELAVLGINHTVNPNSAVGGNTNCAVGGMTDPTVVSSENKKVDEIQLDL